MESKTVSHEVAVSILAGFRKAHVRAVPGFRFGGRGPYGVVHCVPATAQGLADLEIVRRAVLDVEWTPLADLGERGALAARAIDSFGFNPACAKGIENGAGFRFEIDFAGVGLRLPRGDALPESVGGSPLIGMEITDAEGLIHRLKMCASGAAEFLADHGIEYEEEREGGCCCGECDEGEIHAITYVESFMLDESMVADLESAGFLDSAMEALDASDVDVGAVVFGAESMPGVSGDMDWDTALWAFEPDWEGFLAGADYDASDVLSVMPKLVAWLESYRSAGLLPPMPGVLSMAGESWVWEPVEGTFTRTDRGSAGAFVVSHDGERKIVVDGQAIHADIVAPIQDLGDPGLISLAAIAGSHITI